MAKRKKNDDLLLPDVSNENYRLIKAGIKVYPVATNGKWKIHVDNNGKITIFNKVITQKEVNYAINQTITFMFNKLKENERK